MKGKLSIEDEDGKWHEFTDEQVFNLDYSKISKNSQKELDKIMEKLAMPNNSFILESTPSGNKGFFYDCCKNTTFISPSIGPIRPDATFVCDVFKDGNYWQMWMAQKEIDQARSSDFTVTIDASDPQMYVGWEGLHLANLDNKEFQREYLAEYTVPDGKEKFVRTGRK